MTLRPSFIQNHCLTKRSQITGKIEDNSGHFWIVLETTILNTLKTKETAKNNQLLNSIVLIFNYFKKPKMDQKWT